MKEKREEEQILERGTEGEEKGGADRRERRSRRRESRIR